MKNRAQVRTYYSNNLNEEYSHVIKSAYESLRSSVKEPLDYNSFHLGYICGMDNPTLERVVDIVKLLQTFSGLDDKDKEIILLMMDGFKYRSKNENVDKA